MTIKYSTLVSLSRIASCIALTLVVFVGAFSEPSESLSMASWFLVFLLGKGAALGAGYGLYKLYPRWIKADKLLAAYHNACMKGIEA